MTINRKLTGANVAVTTYKRRLTGAWVQVQNVKRRLSGAWVVVWTFFSATCTASVGGSRATAGTCTSSASAVVSITGGVGPFTYAWTYVSGDAGVSAVSPTSASTLFSASVGAANPSRIANWHCTVTDTGNGSATTVTNDCVADLEYAP